MREPGHTPSDLAEREGISERTVRRDLALLRRLGFEVSFEDGYQLWEELASLAGPDSDPVLSAYRRLTRALMTELPTRLATGIVHDLERLTPAAMVSVVATSLDSRDRAT